jgi:hypothetical protein
MQKAARFRGAEVIDYEIYILRVQSQAGDVNWVLNSSERRSLELLAINLCWHRRA